VREPGSFRDPKSRVFYADGQVCRALSEEGREDFLALAASGLVADPRLVDTVLVDGEVDPDLVPGGAVAVLRHERIPFVSYPYEWTFSMLQDAALLQLDLLLAALERDLVLKDATPYNVQFVGARPVFIDIGSFERLHEDELWVGYRQFCTSYLYPLLLQATKGLHFQPWLRGSLEGISPAQMRALMSVRDRFRRGYLLHVFLHARLERRADRKAAPRTHRAGVGKAVITANVRAMRRLVARLRWDPAAGVWLGYSEHHSYSPREAAAKDEFVRRVAASSHWPTVWDLGCNNGRHARIVAPSAELVVAVDSDHATVDRLYRSLRGAAEQDVVLPLAMNLADPSPGLGWRGQERAPFLHRGAPDLVLALALVHHMVIGANVPIRDVVEWLASLGACLVVEFPTRNDPMVQQLLAGKRPGMHADYDRSVFEGHLLEAFDLRDSEDLRSGTRVLYFATPRGATSR
jgi:hypothetical protein